MSCIFKWERKLQSPTDRVGLDRFSVKIFLFFMNNSVIYHPVKIVKIQRRERENVPTWPGVYVINDIARTVTGWNACAVDNWTEKRFRPHRKTVDRFPEGRARLAGRSAQRSAFGSRLVEMLTGNGDATVGRKEYKKFTAGLGTSGLFSR